MEEKNLNYDYDVENDTLFFYTDEYKSSIMFFGIIIDISKNKKIKGIEVLNATKAFSELLGIEVTKEMLSNITKPKLITKSINDLLIMEVDFKADNTRISLPLSISNPNFAHT